ncbi:MAG TPA: efflux RND transporter permease subunit [Bacteroidia bacterium]|nr:efflux RND transporter permease subunit [Bacteroidia bacterium]MBP7713895.1 efflux RND transporter permease subunit [Bacteroidia bacterium]MBP8668076.1 efflux RND transporter permease subunit [Bacteroidia bacterium]HOZ89872.1 efflux RND transporter permease subunit [Bacteroidia bacterium]HQW17764.1 efflux RND transporter permease subunit [Bacteroidia bacterium]
MKDIFKEFKPSSWAIDNRTAIYIITVIITLTGIMSYINIPKESFPDISLPNIYISVVYPGTSPKDMENLVVRHIEKECKGISGVKKIKSNALQDYCSIVVEFNSDVKIEDAKRKVKDAVDRARNDLPQDLPNEPDIIEVNFSDLPIMAVNLSGDYDLAKLKRYADEAKDKIESLKEVKEVKLIGELEREIQINVDMLKLQSSGLTMSDIERAVKYENMTVPGGGVRMADGTRRSLSVSGEFTNVDQIKNLVVNSINGAPIYLKDIAEVVDSYKEQESYARLNHKNVITLSIIKRSGENLIDASDKIVSVVNELKAEAWPKDLNVVLTGDQSEQTRTQLHDLINTIIIGFVLVLIVLMFFMGTSNAFFVAMSVPLSMCVAFLVLPVIGFTINFIVLFSFLLALGIVVDDAIVVIENTHRIFDNGKMDIVRAAKMATGEVFLPVLSGTLTTLAPFVPLAFWKGIIGKFMFFLPITLIITLLASLVVAYIINPVFAVSFMKKHEEKHDPYKGLKITSIIFIAIALLFYVTGAFGMGNFTIFILLLNLLHRFWLHKVIVRFQTKTWPAVQESYKRMLIKVLHRPRTMMAGTVGLLFLSFIAIGLRNGGVNFFPIADPNFVYVFTTLPVGTDQAYTDSVTKILEGKVYNVLGEKNDVVKSVIASVGVNVSDPSDEDQGYYANKSKIEVAFVEYSKRHGVSTSNYLEKIREAVKNTVPGAEVTVAQEQGGPPVGKPISIEVSGDDLQAITTTSKSLKRYLDSLQIEGVEELKSDLQDSKPQIVFDINREHMNRLGIMTGTVGNEINMAVLGREASKYRDLNDEYKIMLRYKLDQRYDVSLLNNLKILYRDMSMGGLVRNVPLSSFATVKYDNTYGVIKRKNQKRVVTVSSNLLTDYQSREAEVVSNVMAAVKQFPKTEGVEIKFAGSQEEQAETMSFLGTALMISLGLIFMILVIQFNSIGKPVIILSEIVFSIIGVLLGFAIFKMGFSIVMTGIGVVALAGIVVRNGILLVEFTELLREQGVPTFEAIVEAGRTRMTPVILTATATSLGLIPLAVGLNIDFVKLFTEFNPHIFFGGDSTAFWGPLSWTMIFGLMFATFLTLFLVPVMYLMSENLKAKIYKRPKPLMKKPDDELIA